MPTAPRRFTIGPARKPWANNSATKRTITGRALQRERARLFADDPLCRECKRHGRITAAVIRDHIVALAFGGKDEPENVQPMCVECHDAKSKEERVRGARHR